MQACQIQIFNWKHYQGEGTRWDRTQWYRQQNNVYEHEVFQCLTGDEYKAKVYIDCMVSKRGHKTGVITLEVMIAARQSGVPEITFVSALRKLASTRCKYLRFQEIPLEQLDLEFVTPSAPEVDTESAPCETGDGPQPTHANHVVRNDTIHNETTSSSAPAEAQPPDIDPDKLGPIPELREVKGAEILAQIPCQSQRVWISIFGVELLKREIPHAFAKWETTDRKARDSRHCF